MKFMQVRLKSRSKNIPPLPLFSKLVGTGLYSGFFPFASGTFGSLTALLPFLIPGFSSWFILLPVIVVFFIIGVYASGDIEKIVGQDPSIVVIDEFVGMWISLLFIPINFMTVGAAFILFRIFDIYKPYPANFFNEKHGGFAVMIDDVIAGIYANVVLQLILLLI